MIPACSKEGENVGNVEFNNSLDFFGSNNTPYFDPFEADQERVNARISRLEAEAAAFSRSGCVVLAGAARRTADLLRVLWAVD